MVSIVKQLLSVTLDQAHAISCLLLVLAMNTAGYTLFIAILAMPFCHFSLLRNFVDLSR